MSALRKLFGPSKEEVWKQLAGEINADLTEGGFWKGTTRVDAEVGEWTVTLDTFVVSTGKSHITYTRMRAPYRNADRFRFRIYRRGVFSDIAKWFGSEDIEVGDPHFDRDFMIQGNDRIKVQYLFGNARIRELITAQPRIRFEIREDEGLFARKLPEGVDELSFVVIGVIKDVGQLKSLFDLFAETLHQLCHIGSAYEDDPGLKL